ncbi:hypothetical protein Marme_3743 [Marinomonas mediterranea MMB-1]|jgi:hypothetical protein|uniref:Uncharacterized protein n=1 Tax=Marinomonas mediterranea (strain ATCC 700492 / JCM 21426 / NBRC 103028 / MMB-1) TaxID=717774 RepID=F2JWT6_MARM1|nr:hypothetical protein Marme_3743 [Marinomonas mediterranea MMB-1]
MSMSMRLCIYRYGTLFRPFIRYIPDINSLLESVVDKAKK